jgi:MFS transporter, DHA2 family, multidrug resistance protein
VSWAGWVRTGGLNFLSAQTITPYSPTAQAAISQLGQGNVQFGGSVINGMITQQAFQISFNELFRMLGLVFIGLVFVIWLAKPPFSAKAGAAAGGH